MKRDGWKDFWELRVSKNQKEMARDIGKVSKGWSEVLVIGGGTHGLVKPISSTDGFYAICFLHEDCLGAGVVGHEMLHVAMAHERFVLQFGMSYGDNTGDDEERLCYFLTALLKGVYDVLYENKHIKKKP